MRYLLLVLIIVGGIIVYTEKDEGESFWAALNPFDNTATSTAEKKTSSSGGFFSSNKSDTASTDKTSEPTPLSNEQIEKEVEKILGELDGLEESLRDAELRDPVSPYAGLVTLSAGKAKDTDADKEYLMITANRSNQNAVVISDWYVESYVTESEADFPEGVELLRTKTDRKDSKINLKPGERAYVITGRSPLYVSFRENECTGYLAETKDVYPKLNKSCPMPTDELLLHPDIKDIDECFEFVEGIKKCEIVDNDELDDAHLSQSCDAFVEDVLEYDGCVEDHSDDPTFFSVGDWRIYLGEKRELWRSTREIIRLMDENDRVVDVVEY